MNMQEGWGYLLLSEVWHSPSCWSFTSQHLDSGASKIDWPTGGVICVPSVCCIQLPQGTSTEQSDVSKVCSLDKKI